jgi:hypothetical protein
MYEDIIIKHSWRFKVFDFYVIVVTVIIIIITPYLHFRAREELLMGTHNPSVCRVFPS